MIIEYTYGEYYQRSNYFDGACLFALSAVHTVGVTAFGILSAVIAGTVPGATIAGTMPGVTIAGTVPSATVS